MTSEIERSWTCDVCRRDIEDPAIANLEWVEQPPAPMRFRLCHKACGTRCYQRWATLRDVLRAGPGRLVTLFLHDPSSPGGKPSYQSDMAEWADVFRRLFSPGYEEVRDRLQSEEAKVLLAGGLVESFAGYWEDIRKELGE